MAEPAVRVGVGVTLVIMLGYGLIVPVLPLYARSFGVGRVEVGVLMTAFGLMRLLFDLVGGPMVDRLGERFTATTGAILVGVSSALSAVAPSFLALVVFRALGGAGSSLLFAAIMNHLVRAVPAHRMARTMSFFYASFLLGTVLGQPLGGIIAEFLGLAAPLWFYAASCFICAGLTFGKLSHRSAHVGDAAEVSTAEVLAESETRLPTAWGRVRDLLSDRAFVAALAANAALFWVLGAVRMTLGPLFAEERVGLSEAGIGGILGAASVAQFVMMWKAGTLADSRGRRVVLVPALAALAVSTAVIGWAGSAPSLLAVMAILGVATGFAAVVPAAVVADVAPKDSSGTAVGAYRFAGDVGFVLGPLIGGAVADAAGFGTAFLVTAVPVVAALVLAIGMPETLGNDRGPRIPTEWSGRQS
jgi:DHA1 family multidrug resistance protein-like MFS transporter